MNTRKTDCYKASENAFSRSLQMYITEKFIRIKNPDINIRIQVSGRGKPLLFIHGGPAAGSLWYQLVARMQDHTCILVDRPGCGLSEPVSYHNLSRERLTDIMSSVIDGVLDQLGIESLPVVGSSFGSYLSMLYTLRNPTRFTKLVVEGCPGIVEKMKVPPFIRGMLLPGLRWLVPRLPTTKPVFTQIARGLGHGYSVKQHLISEAFIQWYISLFNHTDTMKNELEMFSKAVPSGKVNPAFILHDHEIKAIRQPVLWLWGKEDSFGGVDIGNRLHSILNNSTIKFFENAGHLPWIDQPEMNAIKIKEFLIQ